MNIGFSNRMKEVFNYVREEVLRLGDDSIGVEHLFLGIIREGNGVAIKVLNELGVKGNEIRKIIEDKLPKKNFNEIRRKDNIDFKRQAERILKKAIMERKNLDSNEIKTIHVLLAILLDNDNVVTITLRQLNITYDDVIEEYEKSFLDISSSLDDNIDENDDVFGPSKKDHDKEKQISSNNTPVLDNFGRDLTKYAKEDRLDPIVGRHKEIERVSQILSRRKKNNPILVGEPGVGKSAIAEGLA